ncbi:MAG: metallophosphoesterase [Firmicutes bacterium]|nr:metallophosphoesterase [Bacillota bacterium]
MKQTLRFLMSFLLAAGLIFSAGLSAGAAKGGQALKILVASDLHYRAPGDLPPLSEANDLPGDPLFRHANTKGMLVYEADAVLDAFFKKAKSSGAKYLLIPGDLCEARLANHAALAGKLRAFQKSSGIKVFVLPGNHDIRAVESPEEFDLADFLEVYAAFGYDRALARREGDASYTAELDGTYRLLAVDGCVHGTNDSLVSPELFAWIEAQLRAAKEDGKKLIAMTHFNVLEHYLIEGFADPSLCIDGHRRLASALADGGVKYAITGHGHANDIAYTQTGKGNRLFDIETGSLITYPLAWREATFSEESVRFEAKYLEKINTSLLPEGFSKAQINAMKSDFPKYSFDFFTAGFRSYAWQIPQITRRLARNLKIAEGTAGYEAIRAMFDALMEAANIPMYGETGSVEAIAKKGGVAIAQGDYLNPLDLAGVIYAGHFAGNEKYPIDSEEVKLLGHAFNAVLVALLPENDILTALAAKAVYAPSLAKPFTRELVKTLADGVITDWAAPDDMNAVLEPYGEQWALKGYAVKSTDLRFALDVLTKLVGLGVNPVINMAAGG